MGMIMSKLVYVSADWKEGDLHSSDKAVVDRIRKWRDDKRYGVKLKCTDEVHDSVTLKDDCRRCDIKCECGFQIIKSNLVIFVVGDKTGDKKAGPCDSKECSPAYSWQQKEKCTHKYDNYAESFSHGRTMSYLEYEMTTAAIYHKKVIVVFNSADNRNSWIPSWYDQLRSKYTFIEVARLPFWQDSKHTKDCYQLIKNYLE